MAKFKALDLFCCCGGASRGLADAGFEVTGVDITQSHAYPFGFIQSDVFDLKPEFFQKFDFIWASPPCQSYSWSTVKWRNKGKEYPDLVAKTRELLELTNKPYIIENVVGAPIRKNLMLCGEMFGLRVIRHRIFETHGFTILQPKHDKHKNKIYNGTAVGVFNGGYNPGWWGKGKNYYMSVSGHGGYHDVSYKLEDWQKAMGIDWIHSKKHLTQAIPPKYSEYIARGVDQNQCLIIAR